MSPASDRSAKPSTSFAGRSGVAYSFNKIEDMWLHPRTAGNYLYVRHEGDTRTILCVGTCDDLMAEAKDRWLEAVSRHGATHLYVRRIVSSRVRQEELADMLKANEPVMNVVK